MLFRSKKTQGSIHWVDLAARAVALCLSGRSSDQALGELMSEAGVQRPSSQDRSALGDLVFQVLRHWRLTQELVAPEALTPNWAVRLHVLLVDWPDGQAKSFRSRWTDWVNAQLKPEDQAKVLACQARLRQADSLPLSVRWSIPDWMNQRLDDEAPGVAPEIGRAHV